MTSRRLNVGAGHDIRAGWVNLDVAELPGTDVVHDLERTPWPFPDSAFEEIIAINVVEHLSDTIRVMEELHRISAPGARVTIRVPYWNSPDAITDPTHKSVFNERTFDFFDPNTRHGRELSYYSSARFTIHRMWYYTQAFPGLSYLKIGWRPLRLMMEVLARRLGRDHLGGGGASGGQEGCESVRTGSSSGNSARGRRSEGIRELAAEVGLPCGWNAGLDSAFQACQPRPRPGMDAVSCVGHGSTRRLTWTWICSSPP
jgi:hypothetical protein